MQLPVHQRSLRRSLRSSPHLLPASTGAAWYSASVQAWASRSEDVRSSDHQTGAQLPVRLQACEDCERGRTSRIFCRYCCRMTTASSKPRLFIDQSMSSPFTVLRFSRLHLSLALRTAAESEDERAALVQLCEASSRRPRRATRGNTQNGALESSSASTACRCRM